MEISDDKVTISAKQEKFWSFFQQLLTKFLIVEDLYVVFSNSRKRSKGRKNKLEGRMRPAGRTLAMSGLYHVWATLLAWWAILETS